MEEAIQSAKENLNVKDIIDWIVRIIKENIERIEQEKENQISQKEEKLGSVSCFNLLYGLLTGRRMCSYKIVADIMQGQKYLDQFEKRRGIYDIVARYYVGVEEGFRVCSYRPMISSSQEVIDPVFLHLDSKEEYRIGGRISFDGTIPSKMNTLFPVKLQVRMFLIPLISIIMYFDGMPSL